MDIYSYFKRVEPTTSTVNRAEEEALGPASPKRSSMWTDNGIKTGSAVSAAGLNSLHLTESTSGGVRHVVGYKAVWYNCEH